ncbi:MAG: Ig-like domain-containing protein [bacterium]|nr:Ig-like domain-containing protein [bacterium]
MKPEGGTTINGKVYSATHTFSATGTLHTYSFIIAEDRSGSLIKDGPNIYPNMSVSAFLDWIGEAGYENDGVEPDIASYGSTFTYRIKYVNVEGTPPDTGYPTIFGNQMTWVSGTSATGAIYQYQKSHLSPDGTITIPIMLTCGSTSLYSNDVNVYAANIPPLLTWTGETGYKDDGVQPNIGTAGTRFTFRIRYTDPEGDIPFGISLMMNGTSVNMSSVGDGIYKCNGTFSIGKHEYWFYALDSMHADAAGSETIVNCSDISLPVDLASFTVSIGSLTSVAITGTEAVGIDETATFTAHARNEKNEEIADSDVDYCWEIVEETGSIIIGSAGSKTVTIKAGTSTGTITLRVTASPDPNSTLQGDDVTATKTITIKPGKPQALFFSEPVTETNTITVEKPVQSSTGFSVLGKDSYGNVTLVEDCIWILEGEIGGTITPLTGSKTTFTAGTATGTCAVVVSIMGVDGTLTATASITVIAGVFHHFDILVGTTSIRVDGSITITLTPKDANNNTVVDGGTSSPVLKVTVGTNSVTLGTCIINIPVEFPWPPGLRNKLGTGTIYASINGNKKGTSSPFQVVSGLPHHFNIISPATNTAIQAGASMTVAAQLQDMYNNSSALGTSACVVFQSDSFGTFTVGSISSSSPGTITTQTNANGHIAGIYQPNLLSGSTATLVSIFLASDNTVIGTSGVIILTIPAALAAVDVIMPATLTAGISATISVAIRDSYYNPATATLSFSSSLGTMTPAGCVITGSITNGFSWQTDGTWTGTTSFTKAQPQAILNLTAQNGKTATAVFAVLPAKPHSLQPTDAAIYSGTYGDTWTLSVKLQDVYKNLIEGRHIVYTLISNPSNAILSSATVTTNEQGIATTTLTLGSSTGTYSVTASPEGYSAILATFTATTIAGSPTLSSGSYPSTTTVGSKITLEAVLKDNSGNPFHGNSIQWQIFQLQPSSGAVINPSTSNTDNQGIATTSLTLGTKTGMYIVTARYGTLTATFTIAALPDKPAAMTTAITPGTMATVNSQMIFCVGLTDQWGNPAATSTVNWQLQDMAAIAIQTINGTATIEFTLGTKTGVYIVTAISETLTATFNITAIAGTSVLSQNFITASQTVGSNRALEVCLKDEFGNPGSSLVLWSLIEPFPQASSLSATSTPTDQTGSASVILTIGTKTGDYLVRAQVDGYTATFTITAEPDVVGTMLTGYVPSTAAVNTTLPLTIGLYDSYGNPISANVIWKPQGMEETTTQTINGTATLMFTFGTCTGIYEIIASHEGRIATFTIMATPGTPIISQNLSTGSGTVAENVTLEVSLRDEFGNPCPGTITWNLIEPLSTTASFSATSTPTDLQTGSASVILTIGTKTGDYIVRAQVDGYTATFTISALSGNLATDTVSGTSTGTAVVNGTMTFTINIYDEYGNIIQNGSIDWTVTCGTITTATKTTAISNGTTAYSYKADTIAGTYTIAAKLGAILLKLFNVYITHGSPTISSNSSIVAAKSYLPCKEVPLEVFFRDEFGNPCPDYGQVEWTLIEPSSGTASFSVTSTPIDPQTGSATTIFTTGTMTGTYTIKAAIYGQEAIFTITVQERNGFDSKELLIYPNPVRVQGWDYSKYPDGPWVSFGGFNSHVTIRIYDISGNLIRIMEDLPASDGFAKWDMKNDDGMRVNSGIYLCIATCNGEKRIGRFAVIR